MSTVAPAGTGGLPPEALAPTITHLCGQEQHATSRQASADRYRLLITLTGGTAAILVPADLDLFEGGLSPRGHQLSTSLMLFVVVLGVYYRWQANTWRLVVVHLQRQRQRVLSERSGAERLHDNGWLFTAYARDAWRETLRPDPLLFLTLFVFGLIGLGPWLPAGFGGSVPVPSGS